jgi:hypothetical protein
MLARIALASGLLASTARADHHHDEMATVAETPREFDASVSLVAASYGSPTTTYAGDYEGVIPALSWSRDRYSVGASVGLYRILLNGLDDVGLGDVTAHASLRLHADDHLYVGTMLMVTAPTGDEIHGLGMGHTMVMPMAYGAWTTGRVTVAATAGYSRAIAQMEANHDHGVWPLVDPMNMSELTWAASLTVALGHALRGTVHVGGGIPIALEGHQRVIGAARLGWGAHRLETAFEVQLGLVGDPFTVRGLVETALHF